MFFTTKQQQTIDTYDEIKEIVKTLLYLECPEHRSQHHILYSANIRLAHIEEAKDHFRKLIDSTTPIGNYARTAFETSSTKYNELALLIRGYMLLCDETERKRYNHNFLFSKEKISSCYTLLKVRNDYKDIIPIEDTFWQASRAQILPILAQIV